MACNNTLMQGLLKEQLKQKFRNERRTGPSDAMEKKEKENCKPDLMCHDDCEPPAKKARKQCSASKSPIASEGV